jgi:acetolactate synthase-1/2/3 large subunit
LIFEIDIDKTKYTMKISGAEAVIRCLLAEGVDLIYGYPGGAIMPVYDELYKFQDQLHHVLVRHEQGATHAAQGYARATGKVGVAIATSGPGATNLVTGIADAQIDSTPMVCITGQVGRHLLGSDAFQETDIIGISTPVTKWNFQITEASQIPEIIAKAFYIARSGRPGPVLIDITKNAQFDEFDFSYEKCTSIRSYVPVPKLKLDKVAEAAALINSAKKTFYCFWSGNYSWSGRRTAKSFYRKIRNSGRMDNFRTFGFTNISSFECWNAWNARKLRTKFIN